MYFNREGDMMEMIVRDSFGTKIDVYKFKMKDIKNFKNIMRILKSKYGFNPYKKEKPSDIDWLKKTEW